MGKYRIKIDEKGHFSVSYKQGRYTLRKFFKKRWNDQVGLILITYILCFLDWLTFPMFNQHKWE